MSAQSRVRMHRIVGFKCLAASLSHQVRYHVDLLNEYLRQDHKIIVEKGKLQGKMQRNF